MESLTEKIGVEFLLMLEEDSRQNDPPSMAWYWDAKLCMERRRKMIAEAYRGERDIKVYEPQEYMSLDHCPILCDGEYWDSIEAYVQAQDHWSESTQRRYPEMIRRSIILQERVARLPHDYEDARRFEGSRVLNAYRSTPDRIYTENKNGACGGVRLYDETGKLHKEFRYKVEAARYLGVTGSAISRALSRGSLCKGYRIEEIKS